MNLAAISSAAGISGMLAASQTSLDNLSNTFQMTQMMVQFVMSSRQQPGGGATGVPNLPGIPGLPSLMGVPGLPTLPGMTGGGLPNLPGLPGLGGGAPAIPNLPGVPGLPSLGGIPGLPNLPGMGAPAPAAPAPAGGGGGSPPLTMDDLVNYVLAGSKGGTSGTDEGIDGAFSDPNSRFAKAGANEFDAVVAKAYAAQFKGYALGLNVAFEPGKISVQDVAANIFKAQSAKLTPEAELLANVAATYRGDFGNASAYNNPVLRELLIKWGRSDLAAKPLVGLTDVQSVGSVVQALNEQPDENVRKAWLQDIFDFANNTPVSASGAVPNVKEYQTAITLVRSGAIDQLINNYNNGVRTEGPINMTGTAGAPNPAPGGPAPAAPGLTPAGPPPQNTLATPDVDKSINFAQVANGQRAQLGLSDRDRAILHLWGRQIISRGFQDGGIYLNVLNRTRNFTQAEQDLIAQLAAQEQAEFGGITGKGLDREFFALMQRLHPDKVIDTSKWLNTPARFAQGPVNIVSDVNVLQQQTGLSKFDQGVLRLWGHEPLLNGGRIDGSNLAYTIANPNALDSVGNAANGGQDVNIDDIAQQLLELDFASDGVRNGDSLTFAFGRVLDRIYLGANENNMNVVAANAQQKAAENGRSLQQIGRDIQQGVAQAMADAANMVKDHPMLTAASIGGIAAASAVCPFLGGLAIGGAGIAAGQALLNGKQSA
jgi:hypothetical protein